MPSTSRLTRLRERVTTQRNLAIVLAIAVAMPATYLFRGTFGSDGGGFLLLVLLAVGVPGVYDEYWKPYDRTSRAIGWILAACAIAGVEFAGLYLVGTELLSLSGYQASVGAFLVTSVTNLALLSGRLQTDSE